MKITCSDKKLLPSYHSQGACAMDLRASGVFVIDLDSTSKEITQEKIVLAAGERVLVKTGLAFEIPKGHFGSIRGRSGLALNKGINTLGGVIDEDYRGEIGVILVNSSKNPFEINKYDRIAQIIIQSYIQVNIVETESLSETNRSNGGFGSTGHK